MALLAIDQGQTKTAVLLLSRNGEILASATGPGASAWYDGAEHACAMALQAGQTALESAGLHLSDLEGVLGGMTGANWPDEFETLRKEASRVFGLDNVTIVNDAVIALRAGTDSPDAIVLCNGSGMNVALSVGGRLEMVYNNYVEQADQGSEGLGARAFRAAFEAHMGSGPETTLTARLMDHFDIHEIDALMLAFYKNYLPRPLKEVAQIVFEEADSGDAQALECIYGYGKSIARYVTGAVAKYNLDPKTFTTVLTGGVFKNPNPLLYETVCSQIHRKYSAIRIEQAYYEPVVGAALLSLDQYGDRGDAAHHNLQEQAKAQGIVRY